MVAKTFTTAFSTSPGTDSRAAPADVSVASLWPPASAAEELGCPAADARAAAASSEAKAAPWSRRTDDLFTATSPLMLAHRDLFAVAGRYGERRSARRAGDPCAPYTTMRCAKDHPGNIVKLCRIILLLLAIAFGPCCFAGGGLHPVRAEHGMVASIHDLASDAGVEVMQAGGNAIDAAVATGFALAVVYPEAGNLGGGGFMLIRMADGATHFIDYREKAPAAATANMYLDAQGNLIPNASLVGYKAIAVPGAVAGLAYAQKAYGKLPLARVMAPAIKLAHEGFVLAWEDAENYRDSGLSRFPESKRIFQRDGNYYRPGEIFRQPDLARTLERIAQNPDDFYRGAMARELAAVIQNGGGLITAEDLARYEVKEREPIRGSYRGY